MKKEKTVEAKEGQMISYNGKKYMLEKEKVEHGCKGCALENNNGCGDNLTKYCRQGFILSLIKR